MFEKIQELGQRAIVPVVTIENSADAIKLGRALLDGGLPCAEITFRTEAAAKSIESIASALPQVLLGAGTVLTIAHAEKAVVAGAQFIVSPGFNPNVVDWCLAHEVPVIPGVATPTEIEMALCKELTILKFFPAQALGGIAMLNAISAPYSAVRFVPTGGIDARNLADYLKSQSVFACGGSWFVKKELISSGNFAEITRLTREAVSIAQECRS